MLSKNRKYLEFEKNKWIKKKDTRDIDHYEKNYSKIIKLFLNSKYLWGGKTLNGIDCSALIQIYFYYNRIFFFHETQKIKLNIAKRQKTKNLTKVI